MCQSIDLIPFEFLCRMEAAAESRPARRAHDWSSKALRDGVDGKHDADAREPDPDQIMYLPQKWLRREILRQRNWLRERGYEQELNSEDSAEANEPSSDEKVDGHDSEVQIASSSDEKVDGHDSEVQIASDEEDKSTSDEEEESIDPLEFAAMVDCLPEDGGFVTPLTRSSSSYLQESVPKTRRCQGASFEDTSNKSFGID